MEVAESSAVRLRVLFSVKGKEIAALASKRWCRENVGLGQDYAMPAWVPAASGP